MCSLCSRRSKRLITELVMFRLCYKNVVQPSITSTFVKNFRNCFAFFYSSDLHSLFHDFHTSLILLILIDLPSNVFTGITTLKYKIIALAFVSYLRISVVRASQRRGLDSCRGPIVDKLF